MRPCRFEWFFFAFYFGRIELLEVKNILPPDDKFPSPTMISSAFARPEIRDVTLMVSPRTP